jgi:hypothetical protein
VILAVGWGGAGSQEARAREQDAWERAAQRRRKREAEERGCG